MACPFQVMHLPGTWKKSSKYFHVALRATHPGDGAGRGMMPRWHRGGRDLNHEFVNKASDLSKSGQAISLFMSWYKVMMLG